MHGVDPNGQTHPRAGGGAYRRAGGHCDPCTERHTAVRPQTHKQGSRDEISEVLVHPSIRREWEAIRAVPLDKRIPRKGNVPPPPAVSRCIAHEGAPPHNVARRRPGLPTHSRRRSSSRVFLTSSGGVFPQSLGSHVQPTVPPCGDKRTTSSLSFTVRSPHVREQHRRSGRGKSAFRWPPNW